MDSTASIKGNVYFETTGGAIVAGYSSIMVDDKVWFINNVADYVGGAIRFLAVNAHTTNWTNILSLWKFLAKYGGAVFFENNYVKFK